ncbi:putative glutathione S-transferase GST-6.0 [Corynespora cassiicola Philippines]|uniref:Putative glutathione S-transferase GST-6.0 n=1 Tax=Corynespora cassiicola Philippines TaxID=1448308 RepID=A0A2T2P4J9_CORCC|nr:putative glutathione S-transferase GST-6.0 [Corynespora cassiicola Philippines]
MAPKLNLYYLTSSCSLVPHILLHETALPHTATKVDWSAGFPPSLLHLNPKARVPFVVLDDSTVITENPAIQTLIAQLAPEKQLLGTNPLDVVRTYEWLNWLSGTLHGEAYGAWFRPSRYVKEEALYGKVKEKASESVVACYEAVEEKLDGREWAVGDGFTAVDAYLYVFFRWGVSGGFSMDKYPRYAALAKKVEGRGAVLKALEVEGIERVAF